MDWEKFNEEGIGMSIICSCLMILFMIIFVTIGLIATGKILP